MKLHLHLPFLSRASVTARRTAGRLAALAAAAGLATSAALAAGTPEPVRIGGLFDLSGKAQNIGEPTRDVAQLVVDQINRQGGIQGRPLELVIADTQSEPAQAVVALKRLLEKDQVVAVIGPTTTGAAMACLKTVAAAKVPMVACVGGDAPVTPARPWVFKTPQRTSVAVARLFGYLQAQKLTRIGLLCAGDKFGQEGEGYLRKLAPEHGLTIVAKEAFDPATDTDMTVPLTKIAGAKPDAIVVWTIGPAGAVIARNAKTANLAIPLFQCHGQPDPSYLKHAGAAAEGTRMPSTKLMVAAQLPDSDPQKTGLLEFIKLYQERKLGDYGTHSGYAWDAVQLIRHALESVGADNPAALRDAIEKTHGQVGVSGIFTLSPTDHNGLGVDSLVMVEVRNGQWHLLP
ncbi:MAG: ABC transporter substrate-binding protein [Lentisphaeria bacterium]